MVLRSVTLTVVLLAACSVEPINLEGRGCPCGGDWVCEDGVCVPPSDDDAGAGRDAGPSMDGATPDAGEVDGGARDAGSPDGGSMDGGSVDGGSMDGGSDAGPLDAGPTDAGPPDPTACDDDHLGALFCDGFEDEALASWTGTTETGGTVNRTTTGTYRGAGSLRARTTTGSGKASIRGTFATRSSGELWFRGWFYLPAGYDLATVSLLYGGEGVAPGMGFALQTLSGERTHVWLGTAGDTYTSSGTVPRDEWFCYRGHLTLSDTDGVLEAWVGDTRVVHQTGVDTLPAAGYSVVRAGIEWSSSSQSSAEVLVDEIVIDDAPLDCDP